MENEKSLAHTRWNRKYHIVFTPEYRRQVLYKGKRRVIGCTSRKLYEQKGVWVPEAERYADHIHMLMGTSPKTSASGLMGYLKGRGSLMLHEQFGDLGSKYRNEGFWCRGHYVNTVGKGTTKIRDCIKYQFEEDKIGEQLSTPYSGNPFTGRK